MIRIIIPAYNEEKNIAKAIKNIATVLAKKPHAFYVVNDGSRDLTKNILSKLQQHYPLTVLTHKHNKGIAEVFRTGLNAVARESGENDIILIMESDNTSDPSLLPLMIEKIKKGADIVIASRYVNGGKYMQFPIRRLFLSRGANLCFRLLFPSKTVKDYTIFYRSYSGFIIKKAMQRYKASLITTKYFVANAEILVKMMKLTNKIEEIPFVYDYGKKKGASGLHVRRNIWQYATFIVRTKLVIFK